MHVEKESARTIFLEAVENYPRHQWPAYLDQACDKDQELRQAVVRLLEAHAELNHFMALPAAGADLTVDLPTGERVGGQIGRYKLLEQIGEGGMGIVYVAEQTEPVRRKVALKIIKPGMDSRQVIARFEAERQALALMDHPNIAKVFDAGATDGGRPYFVMELVRGLPITEYCDKAGLNPRQRLELFVTVCQAVQHAHQKGIIHRDLKPGNVLVTLHDGSPLSKVIDFGVAKAVSQQLSEHTVYTAFSQMIGTPLYMSPEQAEMTNVDVDTRSDVYSLGVLLYELLTGTTPFDRETLKNASFDEVRRIIREDEPPRPSQRISTLRAEELSTMAQRRGVYDRRLKHLLRGELDWIVMKALEKNRNRRYESASALAADVQRYLANDPVLAVAPSASYRWRKFLARHKLLVAATSAILAVIVVGVAATAWQAIRASAAETKTRTLLTQVTAERDNANDMLRQMDQTVQGIFDGVAHLPTDDPARKTIFEQQVTFFENVKTGDGDSPVVRELTARAHHRLGHLQIELNELDASAQHLGQAVALIERLVAEDPTNANHEADLAMAFMNLGRVRNLQNRDPEAESLFMAAIDHAQRALRLEPDNLHAKLHLAFPYGQLGRLYGKLRRKDEAILWHRKEIEVQEALVASRPTDWRYRIGLAAAHWFFSMTYAASGDFKSAIDEITIALDIQEVLYKEQPQVYLVRYRIALYHGLRGMWCLELPDPPFDPVDEFERVLKTDVRDRILLNNLAWTLCKTPGQSPDRYEKAIQFARDAVRANPDGGTFNTLGVACYRTEKYDEALTSITRSLELQGDNVHDFLFLAMIHQKLGHPEEAQSWLQRGRDLFGKSAPPPRAKQELEQFLQEAEQTLAAGQGK